MIYHVFSIKMQFYQGVTSNHVLVRIILWIFFDISLSFPSFVEYSSYFFELFSVNYQRNTFFPYVTRLISIKLQKHFLISANWLRNWEFPNAFEPPIEEHDLVYIVIHFLRSFSQSKFTSFKESASHYSILLAMRW